MKAVVTIKLIPESRGELIDTFGAQCREYREMFEKAVAKGGMGLESEKVTVRWLFDSGRWDG